MTHAARLAATCAVTLLLAGVAFGHDFWLAPSKFRVAKGETVDVSLRFGMEYDGEVSPRDDLRIEKFVVLGPDGTEDVPGEDMKDPAGRVKPAKDGIYVLAFRGKRRSIELAAAKFEAYLKDEGLDAISKIRADRKETDKAGHEVYSRCAKALLKVGDGAADGYDRVAGLRLEIVPETNPYTAAVGDALAFRVVFEEKPLENAYVVARSKAEPKHTVTARADAKGRVSLKLDRAGEWMVKCVHMVAAPAETGMDWESLWASVTFEIAEKK
jgi:uncharacterized GH25 family protein